MASDAALAKVGPEADLSWANLRGAGLSWADLSWADLFGADLSWADLSEAGLSWADLSGADLFGADLRWADLSWADLRGADLRGANLRGANLRGAGLSEADLSEALGLPVSVALPGIDAAILAAIERDGASLDMGSWHSCETTHCRAGWAVALAPGGHVLEEVMGTDAAAAVIYAVSGEPHIPDWYASNEDALADIEKRAKTTLEDSA